MATQTLYQRLGGKAAIEAAVELFYSKVIADASIKHFFNNVDMNALKRMQIQFLTLAFGGSKKYNGKSLAEAHSHLVDKGLDDSHFDAVLGHLGASLDELGVSADLIQEAAAVAESVRDDVLGRTAGGKSSAKGSGGGDTDAAKFMSAIEGSATSMMMVDRDLVITYANDATLKMIAENLSEFEATYPGFSLNDLIGSCIDTFHKNPAHQRKLLSDPSNLPWKADVNVGSLTFALNVSAMKDSKGTYIGNTLEWSDVTEARRQAEKAARSQSSIDGSATAMMTADRDLIITYINEATKNMVAENIADFEASFPGFSLDDLVGSCIDIFHKNAAHQRKILSDPANLPWKADIKVGELLFELNVSAMKDGKGNYIGNTLEWANVTQARKQANEAARMQSSISGSATAMMMIDRDLVVTYINDATKNLLTQNIADFEATFPGFSVDSLVGTCIDIFHKNPAHQRKILSDKNNLPYHADIRVGDLYISLNMSAMLDIDGNFIGTTLEWANITEARKQADEAARMQSSISGSATAMMMIDRDLVITYVNEATNNLLTENLGDFQEAFPGFSVEALVGTCIDIFHKNPAHQRKILSDKNNLPYRADIRVGDLYITLNMSAMLDMDGNFIGTTLEWANVTESKIAANVINDTIRQLDERTVNLNEATETMVSMSAEVTSQVGSITQETSSAASGAEEMSNTMTGISSAAEQASANINSVAVATEQMTNSVAEIANNAEKAREVTQSAVKNVGNASERVEELDLAAREISKVIEVIVEIAEQTKLLALNATIEAARAGEAGKGFAVVANEVKELAKQTREATIDIRQKIENMQSSTKGTVDEIGNIHEVINDVNEIVTIIATSVEEQNVTTKDIANNISQATIGVQDVTSSVVEVTKVAQEIAENLNNINGGINEVGDASATLVSSINTVKDTSGGLTDMVTKLRDQSAKSA